MAHSYHAQVSFIYVHEYMGIFIYFFIIELMPIFTNKTNIYVDSGMFDNISI